MQITVSWRLFNYSPVVFMLNSALSFIKPTHRLRTSLKRASDIDTPGGELNTSYSALGDVVQIPLPSLYSWTWQGNVVAEAGADTLPSWLWCRAGLGTTRRGKVWAAFYEVLLLTHTLLTTVVNKKEKKGKNCVIPPPSLPFPLLAWILRDTLWELFIRATPGLMG